MVLWAPMYGFLLSYLSLLVVLSSGAYGTSLDEALTKVLDNNLAIKAGLYKSLASKREIANSGARGVLPRIDYEFSTRKNASYFGRGVSTVTLTQQMFDSRAVLYLDQARHLHRIQDLKFAITQQNVLLGAVKAYMGVLSAYEVDKLSRSNLKVLKQHLLSAEKRFSVGEITKTELVQAKAKFSKAMSDAVSAHGKFKAAKASYERIVGETPVSLRYPVRKPKIPHSLEEAVELAKANNFSVKMHGHVYQASKVDAIASVTKRLLPSLSIVASESFVGTDISNATHELRLGIRLPIFEHGVGVLDMDKAFKAKKESLFSFHDAVKEVEESVATAWENLMASRAALHSARDNVLCTEVALQAVTREVELNIKTALDALSAEQELLKAKVDLINAHSNLVINHYNLLALIGQFNIN